MQCAEAEAEAEAERLVLALGVILDVNFWSWFSISAFFICSFCGVSCVCRILSSFTLISWDAVEYYILTAQDVVK